jgi:hypothetical protein
VPEIANGILLRASDDASFLAGNVSPADRDELAEMLHLDETGSTRLLLCRRPRSDRFVEDVQAIAAYIERAPAVLCASLRLLLSVAGLRECARETVHETALAAARDAVAESAERDRVRPASTAMQRVLADIGRTSAMLPEGGRDLASLLSWHSPVAIVVLPRLSLGRAGDWLAGRGAPIDLGAANRNVRGLLVAWRGSGVIFVDGALSAAERDLTIAHEWGHFLFDYEMPRARVLSNAPELIEVVDGYRPRSLEDRIDAVLAGVPLGLHTHLLERDGAGDASWEVALREDVATSFAVEMLAPWKDVLATVRGITNEQDEFELRVARAAAAIVERFGLPHAPAEARALAALRSVGRGRGFFER